MVIGVGLVKKGSPPVPWLDYVPEVDLPIDDPGYPAIRLIDPYGDTSFTSYQCAALIPDFEKLASNHPGPGTLAALDLVRRCARDAETALWFIGD